MAKITPVPNGPLIKKKGPFKGSTLKAGGVVKKAQAGVKLTPQQKRAQMDSIASIKRADIVRKKDSILNRNATARGMTRAEVQAQQQKDKNKPDAVKEDLTDCTKRTDKKGSCTTGETGGGQSTKDNKRNGGPVKKETNTIVKDKTSIPKPNTRGTIRNKPIYNGINPNATKKDSADYKKGYNFGVESPKNSDLYRGLSSNKSWNAGNEEGIKDKRPKKKISMKTGGMIKRADGSMSKRGLWDNIRKNKGSGKKPTKQMLVQEKKIKAKAKK